MEPKSVLYAAVGAPVVAVRKVGSQVEALKDRLAEGRSSYARAAEKAISDWAEEGEKVVNRISEGKVVEELSSKVDLDQAKEQVGKLRDQLEDMISTWRHSFRPEQAEVKVEAEEAQAPKPAAKTPAKKTPAKTPAKKPAAKTPAKKPAAKTSAAKTTKASSAAKTSSAKSTAPKAESTS